MIKDTNLTISVKDMDISTSFYESLGFEMKQRWGNHYAQMTAPGITIGLHPSAKTIESGSGNVSIGFTSENIDDAKSLLEKAEIKFHLREEEGGQFVHFNDPDGTMLYFIKPKW